MFEGLAEEHVEINDVVQDYQSELLMLPLPPAAPAPITKIELDKLMNYHDRQFIELAYHLFLGRSVDESGLAHHLESLQSGESRREIAFRIANSEEGRANGIDLDLFRSYQRWRRVERIPILGAILLVGICMARIRYLVREFRRLQNAAYGGVTPGLGRSGQQ